MDHEQTEADWQGWVEKHTPRFLLFARQHCRNDADAQDLVQEAILESARKQMRRLPPPPPLVFATIRRRAVDLARSHERRTERELRAMEEQLDCTGASPGQNGEPAAIAWFDPKPEDREMSMLVQDALKRVPEMYRDVIVLKLWGGLTFSEISEALAVPANTAASRYRYGIAELRRLTKGVLA
jgi:RNA polymerase sigma-70 factor (ECF subfamily)